MISLMARAFGAMLFCIALIAGGLWHVATTYPVQFWLFGPLLLAGAVHLELRDRRLKREALDLRLLDEHVPSMSPIEYEQFTARQLERAGWKVLHCGRPGDQGCDVLAELRGFKAVVQCKLYRAKVGNDAVQQVVATRRHYGAQIMVVVAPCGFTTSAQALAASNGVHLLHHSALSALERAARIP
jgi:HJR/Mrr/RecB family endonuclease